jgi:menaquinone reductase, molybdopterin-binding-like subunit
MGKSISRRDIIKLVGGSVAGIVLSPVPWKLLDDVSIWSQNWSWMPVPLKGELSYKFNTCTICPAGCAVKIRCVGEQPISVWGIQNHPLNDGALCPLGFGAHHLPYHPSRIKEPVQITRNKNAIETIPVKLDDITELTSSLINTIGPEEYIAIWDQRPERTISYLYRSFLAGVRNGLYLCTGSEVTDTYEGMYAIMGEETGPIGLDIDSVRTIVSFGAPIMEGWGIPGRIQRRIRNNGASGKGFKLIQIETRFSHTASTADIWIPPKPGTDAILALGIGYVLINENLVDTKQLLTEATDYKQYLGLVQSYPPEIVEKHTGVKQATIRETARAIALDDPAVVICGSEPAGGPMSRSEQIAISGLNFLAGRIYAQGGYVSKRKTPIIPGIDSISPVTSIAKVPDHSVKLLIIDEAESGNAVPWGLIEKKLVPETGMIISLSSYLSGRAKHAHYAIPAPTYLESYQDVPSSFDALTATYSVSAPVMKPRFNVVEPFDFITLLAEKTGININPLGTKKTIGEYIKLRSDEIYGKHTGYVYNSRTGRVSEVADISSSQQMWSSLTQGGYWIDEPSELKRVKKYSLLGSGDDYVRIKETLTRAEQSDVKYPLTLMAYGWRGVVDSGPVTPIITKLYQETDFRECTNTALVHPETASAHRLRDAGRAVIETERGRLTVVFRISPEVMPGVIHVALGPDQDGLTGVKKKGIHNTVLTVSRIDENGTWRSTPVRISSV